MAAIPLLSGAVIYGGYVFFSQSRTRTVSICVVTDFQYRDVKPDWVSSIKPLFETINRIFQKTHVKWQPIIGGEAYPVTALGVIQERNDLLKENSCKADVILGLTGRTEGGTLSAAPPFSHTLLVQDTVANTPAMTAILIAHSLANLFGADFDTRGLGLAVTGEEDLLPSPIVTLIRNLRDYDFARGVSALPGSWEVRAARALTTALADKREQAPAEAQRILGRAFASSLRYDDAVRHFREALRDDPQNARWHFDLAMALESNSQAAEAIAELRLAAGLAPEVALYHAVAGAIFLNNGNADPAVEELRIAARMEPRNATYQAALGKALSSQPGGAREAVAAFETAVQLRPFESGAFSGLVGQQYAEQNYDEELRLRQAELTRNSSSAEAHLKVGEAFALAGDLEASQKEIRRAIELEPSNGMAHVALARTYYLAGRYLDADAEIRAASAAGFKPPTGMVEAIQRKLSR
jgi:tetratricopeptide (TPR) repeat protein